MFLTERQTTSKIQQKQQIRSYIRIFSSGGIDPVNPNEYQILDGNTFLDKRNPSNLVMYPFNYIFSPEFDPLKMIQHMNLINDAFDGKNQFIITELEKDNFLTYILGNVQEPGLIVELAELLFYETISHGLKTHKSIHDQKKINTKQKLGISIFSTEGNSNKFIDLILGQKLTYYSKKDMDEFKNFYTLEICSMKDFLIVLKISLIHYKQRCREGDPIVFKFAINSFDQLKNQHYNSYLQVIITQRNSKISNQIIKKLQNSISRVQTKGQDHGSLANYIQKSVTKTKLIYIYGIPYRHQVMIKSKQRFNFLNSLKQKRTNVTKNCMPMTSTLMLSNLNEYKFPAYSLTTNSMNFKEINLIISLLNKMMELLTECAYKWKSYCVTVHQIFQTQGQFYEKQKFPVSLEIKDDNFKNFLISKVYKLSQNFQLEDLSLQFQKLRTIKNQITISLKALSTTKQITINPIIKTIFHTNSNISTPASLFPYSSILPNLTKQLQQKPKQFNRSKYFNQFVQYFHNRLNEIQENCKILFSINYKTLKFEDIDLQKQVNIDKIFDTKVLKESINRLKKQVKTAKNNGTIEKQEILLRKLKVEQQYQQPINISLHLDNQMIQSNSFDNFQKLYNKNNSKHKRQISGLINSQQINSNSSFIGQQLYLSHRNQHKSIDSSKFKESYSTNIATNKSSIIVQKNIHKTNNCVLPKIAVIHHKKKIL